MALPHLGDHASKAGAIGMHGSDDERVAFEVFARALAIGAVLHSWQLGLPPVSAGTVVVAASAAVLIRPSPQRFVSLLAAIMFDFLVGMPDPWNHLILVGFSGGAATLWWLVRRVVDPDTATDPIVLLRHLGPFFRVGFLLAWFFAALAKYNSAFLDGEDNCAVWVLHEMPLVRVPSEFAGAAAVGAAALETAIPLLLVPRLTRHVGVFLGLVFHAGTAY